LRRYVFLDRDGTLVRDVGHPHRLEDYELLDGVGPALRRLAGGGFRLAIAGEFGLAYRPSRRHQPLDEFGSDAFDEMGVRHAP